MNENSGIELLFEFIIKTSKTCKIVKTLTNGRKRSVFGGQTLRKIRSKLKIRRQHWTARWLLISSHQIVFISLQKLYLGGWSRQACRVFNVDSTSCSSAEVRLKLFSSRFGILVSCDAEMRRSKRDFNLRDLW